MLKVSLKSTEETQFRHKPFIGHSESSTSSKNCKVSSQNPYKISRYIKVVISNEKSNKNSINLEVEGITLHSRGESKGISYFECSSHRLRNAASCNFRGRIKNFDKSLLEGDIEIIEDHSASCKFIPGNSSYDLKKNNKLSTNKRNYKTMKIEIHKKLEEENSMTPGEALDWIKKNFNIDNHLSYSQVDEIIQEWRKKNYITKESYIFHNTLNKSGLPFLRCYFTFNYKKNNLNKSIKIAIWGSDFQVNRLRLANHWYVDGTFTIVPCGYHQLITIALRDPNTGFVKPGMWILLDSKEEESYKQMCIIVKNILSSSETLKWNLPSVTLDFEQGLINAFSVVFSETKIIGCLFHFKQALYREAQSLGLTKTEHREDTKTLISSLGALSWKENIFEVEKELESIENNYRNTAHKCFVQYYKNNWLAKLKSGLIDYSDIEDEFRANSVLEQYNSHIKNSLPRSSSWPKFLEFLVNEEANYLREAIMAEQKGEVLMRSVKFGNTFLPKSLKEKKVIKNKIIKEEGKNDSNNSQELVLSNKRRKRDDYELNSPKIERNELKKMKMNYYTNEKDKGPKIRYNKVTNCLPANELKLSKQTNLTAKIKKKSVALNRIEWLKWNNNSCRYDSFLSVFALGLKGKFPDFDKKHANRKHKLYEWYSLLCKTADSLQETSPKTEIIQNFWKCLYEGKIDENEPGSEGSVQELFHLFQPLFSFQPFFVKEMLCQFCQYREKKNLRWPLPIKIQDFNDLKVNSVQEYFDWHISKKSLARCDVCHQNELEITSRYHKEPKIIFIEIISTHKRKKSFEYNTTIKGINANSKFCLIAMVNMPTSNHFTCSIYEPKLQDIIYEKKWFIHDGYKNQGKLVEVKKMEQLWNQKPIIFIYKKL